MRTSLVMGLALCLATGSGAAAKPRVETISYETGPCFGTCPVYKVTVSSDGRGVFEGQRFTAVTGTRAFRVSPAQWRAFRRQLQALHGRGTVEMTGPPVCEQMATDMPTVEVRWSGAFRPFTLRANYGCRNERLQWKFAHLRRAPGTLPIAALVTPKVPLPPGR